MELFAQLATRPWGKVQTRTWSFPILLTVGREEALDEVTDEVTDEDPHSPDDQVRIAAAIGLTKREDPGERCLPTLAAAGGDA